MKGELAFANHLVVELVPFRECGELGSREFGNGMEVETIDCQADKINESDKADGD